jgi:DNA-binding LytR/AlgR family response regulator
MHVAICDDNVADRKHIERLLSRESDKRAGTPNVLYIDSYGNKEKFLVNPLMYNIVFMDMCSSPGIVEEIISKLDEMGFNAPLILYSSKIDYKQIPNLPSYVIHKDKPYLPEPLPELLKLGDLNVIGHVETVSLHSKGILHDVPKEEIMYVIMADNKKDSIITFSDRTTLVVNEDLSEIRRILEPYEEFMMISKKTIANFKYVTMVMYWSLVMQDYVQFRFSPFKYMDFKMQKLKMDELY